MMNINCKVREKNKMKKGYLMNKDTNTVAVASAEAVAGVAFSI